MTNKISSIKIVISAWCLFFVIPLVAQDISQRQILDSATANTGSLFIDKMPLKSINLDETSLHMYLQLLREYSNRTIDTTVLLQLVKNAGRLDTTNWTPSDFPKHILVNSSDENVVWRKVAGQFLSADHNETRRYRRMVRKHNSSSPIDRNIYQMSRPVFDNGGTFAIIQYENSHSLLLGGGTVKLYQLLPGHGWHEVGILNKWSY